MDNTRTTSSASGFMGSLGRNNRSNNIMFVSNAERSSSDHIQDANDDNVTANSNSCTTTPTTTTTTDQNGSESPLSSNIFNDFAKNIMVTPTTSSLSSPKKSSRRSVQKRVVSIPIKEVEGSSRLKGETSSVTSTPPSDSWAWRKYGQKPIKGSPYPRGYYRCSSSKGCPARKQVERSRSDPTMLVVTYSAEHNHPWPASSRTNHHHHHHHHSNQNNHPPASEKPVKEEDEELDEEEEEEESTRPGPEPGPDPEMEPIGFAGGLHASGDELIGSWFGADGHMETAPSVLEIPMTFADGGGARDPRAAVFPVNMMGEEDESLFADLGELPECSLVFRHRGVGPQVEIC